MNRRSGEGMRVQVQAELEHERHELEEALRVERHNSIAPVPEDARDATPLHQF